MFSSDYDISSRVINHYASLPASNPAPAPRLSPHALALALPLQPSPTTTTRWGTAPPTHTQGLVWVRKGEHARRGARAGGRRDGDWTRQNSRAERFAEDAKVDRTIDNGACRGCAGFGYHAVGSKRYITRILTMMARRLRLLP